ncbi:CvpA family protein [Staphylococcus simiae]|nr:CvpA family protein [Staphylococcus simiae]PNZ13698.1 colicin V production protein CvpA [Staphylococcus simiae]SNV68535.1 Colicin V production protein [Staphylococcus simiae]
MIIDLFIIIIFIYCCVVGFRRGCWLSVMHFGATLFSIFVASKFYQPILERLVVFIPYPKTTAFDTSFAYHFSHLQHRFEAIIAILILVILSKFILYLIIVSFDKIVAYQKIHIFSRALGMIIGVIVAVVMLHFILYVLALYPNDWIQQQLSTSIASKSLIFDVPRLSTFTLNL